MKSAPLPASALNRMRTLSVRAILMAVLITSACYSVRVQTLGAPNANFSKYRTFQILDVPPRMRGSPAWSQHPMLNNSITYDWGRENLKRSLEARGLVETSENPDFVVAYYTSARERLVINDWGYGYAWNYYITEYTQGTVVVDIIDPKTKKLLWRGRGTASVSDNPRKYLRDLARITTKIAQRVPAGYQEIVAARGD